MSEGVIHVGAWDGREYRDDPRRPLLLIEPQRAPFKRLKAWTRGIADVEVVCAAVGDHDGSIELNVVEPDHSSSILGTSHEVVRIETVHMRQLDAIVGDRNGYSTLRIDTQGYELKVLQGAAGVLSWIQRVEIEVHDPNVYEGAAMFGELDAVLVSAGFGMISWDADGSDDLGDAVYERCE